jgi:LacI family transcriptional regulator
MSRINQERIARQLKISRATVSRSLNNHPSISEETRRAVLRVATSLGYRSTPSRTLRRRRTGKPLTVGVLIGVAQANTALSTFPYILKGIQERAALDRIAVDVCYQDPMTLAPDSPRQAVFRQIRAADWRGALLIYPFPHKAVEMISRKIATVALLEDYAELGLDSIDVDETAAVVRLVQLLAERGHRRIGYVAWRYRVGVHWTLRRFGAYAEGLFGAGLEFRPEWALNVHKHGASLEPPALAREVARLTRGDRITAWVCAADHQAYHLIHDLQALGLNVPRDCSVTGFDGIEPPPGAPRLTSMRVAHEDIGSSALVRLTSRMLDPRAPRRKILVEASLVEGATVAPPPPA